MATGGVDMNAAEIVGYVNSIAETKPDVANRIIAAQRRSAQNALKFEASCWEFVAAAVVAACELQILIEKELSE